MDINQAFPSKWLKASDLQGRAVRVEILRVDEETFQDGTFKPVISFVGKDKGMVLNRTNAATIAAVYGNETDAWKNKPLELFSMKVQGPNGIVDGIRVRVPEGAETDPASAHDEPADLDDDIPF